MGDLLGRGLEGSGGLDLWGSGLYKVGDLAEIALQHVQEWLLLRRDKADGREGHEKL